MKVKILLVLLLVVATVEGGNIALYQPAVSSSTLVQNPSPKASRAVDGDPRSDHPYGAVTQWSSNPWWRVDLGTSYVIDDVFVIGRSDCCPERINGAVITVGDNIIGTLNARCTSIDGVTSHLSKSFKCAPPLRGQYVTIHIPGENRILSLYEVMVNENPTANLAKSKPTAQSSTSHSSSASAVDGNRDANFGTGSCTHTALSAFPWWRVDLGSSVPVSEVFIVNRVGLTSRLVNMEIRVGDSLIDNGNANPRCGETYSMAGIILASFYCKPRKSGSYVNIRLAAGNMFLTLCEVEVYSESKAVLRNKPLTPTKLNLIEWLPARMQCPESFGYPVPYIAWFKDGVMVQNDTSDELILNKTLINKRNDSVWECVVTNKYGSDFHHFIVQGSFKMCAKYTDLEVKDWSVNIKSSSLSNNSSIINDDTWYRLTDGNKYLELPERCVSPMHCSAQATGWMQGSHPSKQDLVVERTVCFSWDNNCCRNKTTVLVRRCHGYYVYKLKKTAFDKPVGYCTVQATKFDQDFMLQSGPFDHALMNHVTKTEASLTMLECISACLAHSSCQSVNHDTTTQVCEMNNSTRHESFDQDWAMRPGNQYYELLESMTP